MNNDIFVVSYPDDVLQDATRILCASLSLEQQQLISTALLQIDTTQTKVIVYIWNTSTPVEWLIDKKSKSDIIFFDAQSSVEMIIGYLAAHKNSYYFGNLKDLHAANNRAINSTDDILTLLEKVSKNYE